jgi:salicylate hydroxylase
VVRNSFLPDATNNTLRDSCLDVTRITIPEAIIRSDPDMAPFMESIHMYYGPSTTVCGVALRRGM